MCCMFVLQTKTSTVNLPKDPNVVSSQQEEDDIVKGRLPLSAWFDMLTLQSTHSNLMCYWFIYIRG